LKCFFRKKGGFMLAGPDLLVIMVIAMIVFGPKKLPEIGQTIGKAMREFKKASEEAKESFEGGIKELAETNESDLTEKKFSADLPVEVPKPLALLGTPLPKAETISEKTIPSGDKM
jgi:sec-independent protein translocase protein TatA